MSKQIYTDIRQLKPAIEQFHAQVAQQEHTSDPVGICGFDGFIDTFIHLRQPASMADFGPSVAAAAGIAASYVSEHKGDKFGGNGPLIAAALSDIHQNQIDLSYIGALGKDAVLPIYQAALGDKIRSLYTLAEPAHSDCLEFEDGKVMLCDMRSCAEITWERLLDCVGSEALDRHLRKTQFIAAVNWGKLPHVGTIWTQLAERLRQLNRAAKEVLFFMDLAEFEQRSQEAVEDLLHRLGPITKQCNTILSFNLKEAWQMADHFGGSFHGISAAEEVTELACFLQSNIAVDRIIIHPNDGAACASAAQTVYIPGPHCKQPLISTGAGDNFGAGCIAAALAGMDDREILLAGNCASGHFVRSGRSASFADMCALLDAWYAGTLPERL